MSKPERAVTLPNGCEQHGLPAYRDDAGTVHIATGARCVGPDAERDERVRLRRAVDARRAGIALDALLAPTLVTDSGLPTQVAADQLWRDIARHSNYSE